MVSKVLETQQTPPPSLFIPQPSSIADPGDPPLFALPHTKPRSPRSIPQPSSSTDITYHQALAGVALTAWALILANPTTLSDLPIPTSIHSPLTTPNFPSLASPPRVSSHWPTLNHSSYDDVSQTCEVHSSWSDEERALNAAGQNNTEDGVPHDDWDYEGDDEESDHSIDSRRPQERTYQPPMYQVATLNWGSQSAPSSSPVAPLVIGPTVLFQAPTSPRPIPRRLPSPPLADLRDSSGSSTAIGTVASDLDTLVPLAPNPESKSRLRRIFNVGKDTSIRASPQVSPLSQEVKAKSWFSKIFSRKTGIPK